MANISVIGAQWGDEGKGKVVDLLAKQADVVARYAGGSNAGHTLVVDGTKVVVHLLPSGVIHHGKECMLGNGMVVDIHGLLQEIDQLKPLGLDPDPSTLVISDRAHIVLPFHMVMDGLREGSSEALGTTRRGIGPTYQDKVARRGIRMCDLKHPERLRARLRAAYEGACGRIPGLASSAPSLAEIENSLLKAAERILPHISDVSARLHEAISAGKRVLFEGAQGVLLDVDYGTFPYVTSSTTLAGGASAGLGIGPQHLGLVLGVTKAYTTRVGNGPFPTELTGEEGDALRKAGNEYGATTGRPRRCGWLDLQALRYAARVSGMDGIALTKLDVLADIGPINVCVGYRLGGKLIEGLPSDNEDLAEVEPVYEQLDGFSGSLCDVRRYEELPQGARAYVEFVEKSVGCPVLLVSVGPEREQTIVREPLWADDLFTKLRQMPGVK